MSARGFTLLETTLAILVLAILLAGLAVPLSTQVTLQRLAETRRQLDEAREAVLGFASAHGRLPCPATPSSRGEERFAPGSDARDGHCEAFFDGFLPAATLGLANLDDEGFVRDAWGAKANRLRYAVHGGRPTGGIENALTRVNGLRLATMDAAGGATWLVICASGTSADSQGCGPATLQLTRRAAFVVHSSGPNAPHEPPRGSDEARNRDGDGVFVAREQGADYDDVLTWAPIHGLLSRMVAAGRLP